MFLRDLGHRVDVLPGNGAEVEDPNQSSPQTPPETLCHTRTSHVDTLSRSKVSGRSTLDPPESRPRGRRVTCPGTVGPNSFTLCTRFRHGSYFGYLQQVREPVPRSLLLSPPRTSPIDESDESPN